MKKADLEREAAAYQHKLGLARSAQSRGMYRAAMEAAVSAWEHVDGMMQYGKRYEDAEFDRIDAIDLALTYVPLLLDFRKLDELEGLLAEVKRIRRNASDDFDGKVSRAREQLRDNHRLWGHLQGHPGVLQEELARTIGGDQARWRAVAESWERMGLVLRVPEGRSYRLYLATQMGAVVRGKCPRCGEVADAPKGMLLEPTACPACRASVIFVLLADRPAGQSDSNKG
jgi:hypothetical protein